MKFPYLSAAFLLLAVIAILAGCSSAPSPPVSPTPVAYTNLSQLVLSGTDIPFRVMAEKNQNPDMRDPTISQFGATRGYSQFVMNQTADSATTVQLGQVIVEYPPGNAALAFATFVNQSRNTNQSQYKLTWLPDPGIGDRSSALTVTDSTGATKPTAMIVFTKANIMESVVLVSPSLDMDFLTRAARLAAAKIPA